MRRRLLEHNGGGQGEEPRRVKGKGARYTVARRPVTLVFERAFPSRSEALKEEARVKRLDRRGKQQLIAAGAA